MMRPMRSIVVALLVLVLAAGATPVWAIFGIPSPEDLLVWLVLEPMMRRNQDTQIGNQVRELREMVTALQTATRQLTQVRAMAQGQIGAIASPVRNMMAVPSTLLDGARGWQNDFTTGRAAEMVRTMNDFRGGTSLADGWRNILVAADTVSEADILAVYTRDPAAGQRAVEAFRRRRAAADARLERTAAREVAAADIQALGAATAGTIGAVSDRVDSDPGTGGPNLSGTALEEGDAITRIAQLRMLNSLPTN